MIEQDNRRPKSSEPDVDLSVSPYLRLPLRSRAQAAEDIRRTAELRARAVPETQILDMPGVSSRFRLPLAG